MFHFHNGSADWLISNYINAFKLICKIFRKPELQEWFQNQQVLDMRRNITWSHRITKSRRKGIFRAFFFTALNPGEFSKNPLQSGSCPLELAHPMLVITLERCSEQKESAGHLELHQPLAGGTPSTAVRVKPISRDCGKEGSQETKHAEASCTRAETAQTKWEENQ